MTIIVATGNAVTFCLNSGSSRVVTNGWMKEGLRKSLITDQTEDNTNFNVGHTTTLNCRIQLNFVR